MAIDVALQERRVVVLPCVVTGKVLVAMGRLVVLRSMRAVNRMLIRVLFIAVRPQRRFAVTRDVVFRPDGGIFCLLWGGTREILNKMCCIRSYEI